MKAKWNLTLPLSEARRNDEMISLSDSQMLRFIDRLNGVENADFTAKNIKNDIKNVKKLPNSAQNRKKIKELYEKLDEVQFKPDYMHLVIDRTKDYLRACKGFKINGVKYVRLLGTNGGIKNSTIVFVSERLAPELRRLIDNGRDKTKELVPAKLEAYQALVCSGSIPVSMPKGIAVVDDCVTKFKSDVISINDECVGEPIMEFEPDVDVELDESDGYGIMLPSLAERWSSDLQLDYLVSGVNTRFSWEKGMVFTFDFLEFADNVAGTRVIKDAWGNDVDLSNIELILTTSMLKLWDSYESCESYLECCRANGYTFGVTKTCPKELETRRGLNYQFIQSYDLTDEQIEALIAPTVNEIHDVLGLDVMKSLLFLRGFNMDERDFFGDSAPYIKALMADRRMIDDPYVRKSIHASIKNRINEAKIGVLDVHGNYSIVSGDPYSLCQNMFGLEVTGILKSGEIYNKYWCDVGAEKLACYRAPMTCHNNIRLVRPCYSDEAKHWYQYMTTCTVLNSWDTIAHALNGCDKDGDLVMLTDNHVLVDNLRELPALMCVQRKAQKKVVSEEDLIAANIASFGDDIGKITNHITAMFEVQSRFSPDSEEYKVLDYRIKCGQHYQQCSIDKAKGIISKPMPRTWFDRGAVIHGEYDSEDARQFDLRIVADRKPYFMRYIYPALMSQYNTYIKSTSKNALRRFRMPAEDLLAKNAGDLTQQESDFVQYYHLMMPVGVSPCVMNRICTKVELEFDAFITKYMSANEFDYTIMKRGVTYSKSQYNAVADLYMEYKRRIADFSQIAAKNRIDRFDANEARKVMMGDFKGRCACICANEAQLCDLLLDLCYVNEGSKQFVWDIVGDQIVANLLEHNDNKICLPVKNDAGPITYCGTNFVEMNFNVGDKSSEYSHE